MALTAVRGLTLNALHATCLNAYSGNATRINKLAYGR